MIESCDVMNEEKRLNKYISESGYCSRREADKLILSGVVKVNGLVADLGTKVPEGGEVKINNKSLKVTKKRIYIAFNKPVGVTSTTDLKDATNIIDYINYKERIFPIGRLDKMSEGLIFLTNDGDIVNKILRAGNNHEKEYIVTVDHAISDDFLRKMGQGVRILKTVTQPCVVQRLGKTRFKIILTQGLNRQIRRMCETLGYTVTKLKRVRIMNVELKDIELGQWRYLNDQEMLQINGMVADSLKTEEASENQNMTKSKRQGNKSRVQGGGKLKSKYKSEQAYRSKPKPKMGKKGRR